MERISTPSRTTVSFDRYGSGPPLVLVHGGFSDHVTNWQEARPWLADRFSVWAVARRGRGDSSATAGHTVEDEASDVAAVLRRVGEPAFLLGHSYGALVALRAAARQPASVRKLVLYEPPHPQIVGEDVVARLEAFGEREDWDGLVEAFMLDVLQVPPAEVKAIREIAVLERLDGGRAGLPARPAGRRRLPLRGGPIPGAGRARPAPHR